MNASACHAPARMMAILTLLVAAALLAGCGSTRAGTSATSDKPKADDDKEWVSPTDMYADTELADLSLKQLQTCESDATFYHKVLYEQHEATAQCGDGHATVTVGKDTFDIEHGWCEVDSGYVTYQFGTSMIDYSDDADTNRKYGPASFALSMGDQVKGAKPVDSDGTFVDGPAVGATKYGSTLTINRDPRIWTADTLYKTLTLTASDGRTSGTVKATNHDGTPISVSFECGDKLVGEAAPGA